MYGSILWWSRLLWSFSPENLADDSSASREFASLVPSIKHHLLVSVTKIFKVQIQAPVKFLTPKKCTNGTGPCPFFLFASFAAFLKVKLQ